MRPRDRPVLRPHRACRCVSLPMLFAHAATRLPPPHGLIVSAPTGMHGPDTLVEGKQMAFEAQIREHAKEMGGSSEGQKLGTGTGGVMDRAYQGLQALSRKLLGGKGGTNKSNNNPAEVQPSVGEVGALRVWLVVWLTAGSFVCARLRVFWQGGGLSVGRGAVRCVHTRHARSS